MKIFAQLIIGLLGVYLVFVPDTSEARLPRLQDEIEDRIDATKGLSYRTLEIIVLPGGHVTLVGNVNDVATRARIEEVISGVPRVRSITNNLNVIASGVSDPTFRSSSDQSVLEGLDSELTRARPDFSSQDVEVSYSHGTATIEGEVDSTIERDRVEAIVSKSPEVRRVINNLKVRQ